MVSNLRKNKFKKKKKKKTVKRKEGETGEN